MACLSPIKVRHPALRGAVSQDRLRSLFDVDSYSYMKESAIITSHLIVPCGSCYECRRARSSSWRTRLLLENLYGRHRSAVFVTLTLDSEHLSSFSEDPALFWRRFRDRFRKAWRVTPRWWFTTELGERTGRLHLHGIIWDLPFYRRPSDRRGISFMVDNLKSVWKYGHVWIDYASDRTMSYITKYMLKTEVKDEKGNVVKLSVRNFKPRVFCSPGIGRDWGTLNRDLVRSCTLTTSHRDSDYHCSCHVGGISVPLPRYFRQSLTSAEERRTARYLRRRSFFKMFGSNPPPLSRIFKGRTYVDNVSYCQALQDYSSKVYSLGLDSYIALSSVDIFAFEQDSQLYFNRIITQIEQLYGTSS